jgi:two-component system, NarL family, sensor histidine kinase UhpB
LKPGGRRADHLGEPVTRPSLLTQVLGVNALVIVVTVAASAIAVHLNPVAADERMLGLLAAALLATVLVNGVVLRRRFQPLERLIEAMERVDVSAGRARVPAAAGEARDVTRLREAFDRVLARLEDERARTAAAVLEAQESERARVARDLHDEANQALTGVLLRLSATAETAPPELRRELHETQRVATQAMEELLRLARELRPAALDDLGLAAALRTLVRDFGSRAGVRADIEITAGALDALRPDEQLVAYRVVQEGLSNVARHAAGVTTVHVSAVRDGDATAVRVADDGCGFDPSGTRRGLGLTGMRERAALTGGAVAIRSTRGAGTVVDLRLGRAA